MGIRWKSEDLLNGYGVYGNAIENDGSVVLNQVLDTMLGEIPFPLVTGGFPVQNYVQYFLLGSWRFSLELLTSSPGAIRQYYNPLGIKQLGRWYVTRSEYSTQEGFWSQDLYMSPKFIFSAVIDRNNPPEPGEFEFEERIPSSLPQDETEEQDPPFFVAGAQSDGLSGGLNNSASTIADSVYISVEPGVLLYRLGITYDYFIEPYTASLLSGTSGLARYLI